MNEKVRRTKLSWRSLWPVPYVEKFRYFRIQSSYEIEVSMVLTSQVVPRPQSPKRVPQVGSSNIERSRPRTMQERQSSIKYRIIWRPDQSFEVSAVTLATIDVLAEKGHRPDGREGSWESADDTPSWWQTSCPGGHSISGSLSNEVMSRGTSYSIPITCRSSRIRLAEVFPA